MITAKLAALTRALHRLAVRMHCETLRATVKSSDAGVRKALEAKARADAIRNAAAVQYTETLLALGDTLVANKNTRTAAYQEAQLIGGSID